jgi:serine O-acetyltransferase
LRAENLLGPTIEEDVQIGTGAKVLGPLRIGAGARVGANAVVVDDVPAGTTVVGAPARPL